MVTDISATDPWPYILFLSFSHLEDLDLARCAVNRLFRFLVDTPAAVANTTTPAAAERVSLDLDAERNALLAAALADRELGADAVDPQEDARLLPRVPRDDGAVQTVVVHVHQAVRQRHV